MSRPLSRNECRAIVMLGRGYVLKDMADTFGVSTNTASTWRKRAYQKLGARTAAEAVTLHRRVHQRCHQKGDNAVTK